MRKLFLAAHFLLLLLLTVGAQNTTSLSYKYFGENNKGLKMEGGKIDFWGDNQQFFSKKEEGKYPQPLKCFDFRKHIVVFDMEPSKEYFIEELDSVYEINSKIVPTEEVQTINGYQCRKYTLEITLAIKGAGIYGTQTSRTDYHLTFWITEDKLGDEHLSKYIASCLTNNIARFNFKGTIVKVETSMNKFKSTILLDKTTTAQENDKTKTPYIFPWQRTEQHVAWLPDIERVVIVYTNEDFKAYYDRMRALLTSITGIEKPKFKIRAIGIGGM